MARREYTESDWSRLEHAGGFNEHVPSSHIKSCSCGSTVRPFKCTNKILVMLCATCMNVYLTLTEEGVEDNYTPIENNIRLSDGFLCELFEEGETGWAADEDVDQYDWSVNELAFRDWSLSRDTHHGR